MTDNLKQTNAKKKELKVKYELCNANLQEREKIVSNLIGKGKEMMKLLKGTQEVALHLKTVKDALIKDFIEVKDQMNEELLRAHNIIKELACLHEKEKNQKIKECNVVGILHQGYLILLQCLILYNCLLYIHR